MDNHARAGLIWDAERIIILAATRMITNFKYLINVSVHKQILKRASPIDYRCHQSVVYRWL